ncbi:MAG: hypothetical protein H7A45_16415 [Verrucomicrobiales bacterium]|nr:hypothetical protein [Verrucomicrobiales bacterium]MCP5527917.1 hypothetical protein [Verrucomicrobiales bacterium]
MSTNENPLPLVVQVGFAGSRDLFPPTLPDGFDPAVWEARIEARLIEELEGLREWLRLPEARYFFCGISQIATGGDTIFSRACHAGNIPQRHFLPQAIEDYVRAVGSQGPDFTPEQADEARRLNAEHSIHTRILGDAPARHSRFEEVNHEIVRVSDVVVCLFGPRDAGKRGGTADFRDMALRRGRPVLEIRISVHGADPDFEVIRHVPTNAEGEAVEFSRPELPGWLEPMLLGCPREEGGAPTMQACRDTVGRVAGELAGTYRRRFERGAVVIILAHLVATLFAVVALKTEHLTLLLSLLALEVVVLLGGFVTHVVVQVSRIASRWALVRCIREVEESLAAVGGFHLYPGYLFTLPFPESLRPLFRTFSVLHLKSTCAHRGEAWEEHRAHYVRERLTGSRRGQIEFFKRKAGEARSRVRLANGIFRALSLLALAATSIKLLSAGGLLPSCLPHGPGVAATLGILAVVLPVAAVGALSLAASFDWEGRAHTFAEMREFLEGVRRPIEQATSEREFHFLATEIETRLLGETANWASRRSFHEPH